MRNHSDYTFGINGTSSNTYGHDDHPFTSISDTASFSGDGLTGGVDTYLKPQSGSHYTGNTSRYATHTTYKSADFPAYRSPQELEARVSASSYGYSTAQNGEMVEPHTNVLHNHKSNHDMGKELGNNIIGPSYTRVSPSQIDSGPPLWNPADYTTDLHHPTKSWDRRDEHDAKQSLDNIWLPSYPQLDSRESEISASASTSSFIPTSRSALPGLDNAKAPIVCLTCAQTFTRRADLKRHTKKHQPNMRVYHCYVEGCNYRGNYRKDKLQQHVSNRHHIG